MALEDFPQVAASIRRGTRVPALPISAQRSTRPSVRSTPSDPALPLGLPANMEGEKTEPHWPFLTPVEFMSHEDGDAISNIGDLFARRLLEYWGIDYLRWVVLPKDTQERLADVAKAVQDARGLVHLAVDPYVVLAHPHEVEDPRADRLREAAMKDLERMARAITKSTRAHDGVLRRVAEMHHPFARVTWSLAVQFLAGAKRKSRFRKLRGSGATPAAKREYARALAHALEDLLRESLGGDSPRVDATIVYLLFEKTPREVANRVLRQWPHRHAISVDDLIRSRARRGRR